MLPSPRMEDAPLPSVLAGRRNRLRRHRPGCPRRHSAAVGPAIAGIASGGVLKRPHVVFPDEIPPAYREYYKEQFPGSGDAVVSIDPANWEIVTDAMAQVPTFAGTAGMAHLNNIDFAGKTGSAQTVSNAYKKSLGAGGAGAKLRDNAWFVGVSPRRNPEIAVVILWEGGSEGYLSARLAAQVIEAYVDKQRRMANNLHPKPETKVAAAPAQAKCHPCPGANPAAPRNGWRVECPSRQPRSVSRSERSSLWPRNRSSRGSLRASRQPDVTHFQNSESRAIKESTHFPCAD